METSWSVRASIMAIIILIIVSALGKPTIVKASSLKTFKLKDISTTLMKKNLKTQNEVQETLTIEPANKQLQANIETLKIEIDLEELRQIKIAREKALELQRKKEEEERQKAIEKAQAEAKAKIDAKSIEMTSITYDELVAKLNRSLNSSLSGRGESFAKYSIELGIDPYLAVAIVLHETGCKWNCSTLLKQCNNVGGMKGTPGCNGGSYKAFSSLDEGIKAFMNNLYKNYYAVGLTTPETIGPKYAASQTWASKVRSYMREIEAN